MRLDFAVPENLLGRLKPGQTVNATSAAYQGRIFKGTVATIDTRVDQTTRTARLTAEFDNPDEALKPGMFLSVALEVTTKDDAVVVPEEAVVSEGLRQIVYPVKDNKVERRVIRIGQRQGGKVEVVDGPEGRRDHRGARRPARAPRRRGDRPPGGLRRRPAAARSGGEPGAALPLLAERAAGHRQRPGRRAQVNQSCHPRRPQDRTGIHTPSVTWIQPLARRG